MKKCPSCSSSRYNENNGIRHCYKCGYTNDMSKDCGIPKVIPIQNLAEKKTSMEKIIDLTRKSIEEYESFYTDFEEDTNPYAKMQQDKEIQKMLKRIITRINYIQELALEEK